MITDEEVKHIVDNDERMYAPVEVAHILNKTTATIQTMCRDGRINAVRQGTMWRISRSEVMRFIAYGPLKPQEQT